MASSISSSSVVHDIVREPLPSGLRLTAADRPGVAQPVPERDIPDQPWRAMSLVVLVLVILFTSLWEWKMRRLELVPGDSSGTYDRWAELRRQVDKRDVPVAIISDSRLLYDTDLDRTVQLTGVRPLQLGIAGGSALPILEDIADDPHFKGLAIVGMAESVYFDTVYSVTRPKKALALSRWESPSNRASFVIQRVISPRLAMLDDSYQLSTLIFQLDPDWRRGVKGPYHDVWKVGEMGAGGQAWIWRRLEHDRRLSDHARTVWHEHFQPFPIKDENVQVILERTKIAVDKIRARGGDVVFVRSPSAPDLRVVEDKHIPRARGWDPLLAYTHTNGIHIDDLPTVQNLTLPESSHLSHACATVFTDAYIRVLAQQTSLLHLKSDLPPTLSTRDCVPSAVASTD
ncbi:hypothetical protein [Tunturiibacter gelidoferens]|uniref:Uncharacterized protein n=1 Tax=Tunturiibacter lichenicola TaxID=2051959 RepID=A0A7Y9NJF5_9BACT|nr:hypothetical protein [Edaphobacter lichenicola]NYF50267.1 hypothetical protein [Edaphobacter lichenicola]